MGEIKTIEIDRETAELLEARAAARGLSVAELVADLAFSEQTLPPDLQAAREEGRGPWAPEILAEDARRLAAFREARAGAPWEEVQSWLRTWGKPGEAPRPRARGL